VSAIPIISAELPVGSDPPMLLRAVILWYYVLLLLRKLEIQRFTQVSIPFCMVAYTSSARGSVGIGSA